MLKLRNKIQEKKAELKLDNAELGLAIGRGERYIDRLLRDTVSTAKQEEIIDVLDGLSFSRVAAKLQMQSRLEEKYTNIIKHYRDQIKDTQQRYEACNASTKELTISAGNMAEQFDRSAKQLAASVAQNENLKEQIKNMAMQLSNVELDNKELQGEVDSIRADRNLALTQNHETSNRLWLKIHHAEDELAAKNRQLSRARFICALLTLVLFIAITLAFIQW